MANNELALETQLEKRAVLLGNRLSGTAVVLEGIENDARCSPFFLRLAARLSRFGQQLLENIRGIITIKTSMLKLSSVSFQRSLVLISSRFILPSTVTWPSSDCSRPSAVTPWPTSSARPSRAWCCSATEPEISRPTGLTSSSCSGRQLSAASSSSPSLSAFRVSLMDSQPSVNLPKLLVRSVSKELVFLALGWPIRSNE